MGKGQSKAASTPLEPKKEEKDDRWELKRDFGPKYQEYNAKVNEIKSRPLSESVKRPVHSSVYFRGLPQFQSWWFHIGVWALVLRKMPFTNPLVRMYFWLVGIDLIRGRIKWVGVVDKDDLKEAKCFDRIYHQITTRYGIRVPDFKEEWEDWYDMNKPAYRVPVGHEYNMDSWMRYLAFNHSKYMLKPVQWNGDWEQEISLNMDLHAPHADHWLDIH